MNALLPPALPRPASWSAGMAQVVAQTEAALAVEPPSPPSDPKQVGPWLQSLQTWFERKDAAVRAINTALDACARCSQLEGTIGSALAGGAQEDLIDSLAHVALPAFVSANVEVERELRATLLSADLTIFGHAMLYYSQCEARVAGDAETRAWGAYCKRKRLALEPRLAEAKRHSSESSIEPAARDPGPEPKGGTACWEEGEPPEVRAKPPRAKGRPRIALVVDAPSAVDAPLTQPEIDRVRDATRARLMSKLRGASWVPSAELEQVVKSVERGTDPVCATTKTVDAALLGRYDNLWIALIGLRCSWTTPDCGLRVGIYSAGSPLPKDIDTFYKAAVDGDAARVDAWLAAAAKLEPHPGEGGLGVYSPPGDVPFKVNALVVYGDWTTHDALQQALQRAGAALAACRKGAGSWDWDLLLESTAPGGLQVLRQGRPAGPEPSAAACVAQALSSIRLPASKPGGRALVNLKFAGSAPRRSARDERYGPKADGGDVRAMLVDLFASDEEQQYPVEGKTELLAALARCHARNVGGDDVLELRAELDVDRWGHPGAVTFAEPTPAALRSCLEPAFEALRFSCSGSRRKERVALRTCSFRDTFADPGAD